MGLSFMVDDIVDGLCELLEGVRIKFWACHNGCHGYVSWEGDLATCQDCGATSAEKSWCVYIVECSDGTLYTGATNNLDKRLKAHNDGKGAKYTRCRRPVKLLAARGLFTKSEALSLEWKVKQKPRADKVAFLREKAK